MGKIRYLISDIAHVFRRSRQDRARSVYRCTRANSLLVGSCVQLVEPCVQLVEPCVGCRVVGFWILVTHTTLPSRGDERSIALRSAAHLRELLPRRSRRRHAGQCPDCTDASFVRVKRARRTRGKSNATKMVPRLRVTSRVGATARDGSRPRRRRRGIASILVRVRRPHRQQAPFQRVCGCGWRECNHLESHSALRERRQLELPRRRQPRTAVLVRRVGERREQGGGGGVGGCVAPEIFPSTASCRSRALPSTARRAVAALPAVHCQTREDQSGGRIPPRTSSGEIWQCLGSV